MLSLEMDSLFKLLLCKAKKASDARVGSQARPSCPDQRTPEVDRCSYCGLANCLQPQHVPVQAFLQKAITDYTLVMERTPIDLSEQCNH